MNTVRIDDFEEWRDVARMLLARGVPPREVAFVERRAPGLLPGLETAPLLPGLAPPGPDRRAAFAAESVAAYETSPRKPQPALAVRVPAALISLARRVACHRDPSRWDRLYRVLWRAVSEGAVALDDPADADVAALGRMAEAVRHDVHRVHALVRFRRIAGEDGAERYVAFHRPEHRTLRLAAPFFTRRFAAMRWSILTPDASAHWDGASLSFGPGAPVGTVSNDDAEELWRAYYASSFIPERVNPRLVRSHLPRRHWDTLPEGRDIAALVRAAQAPSPACSSESADRGARGRVDTTLLPAEARSSNSSRMTMVRPRRSVLYLPGSNPRAIAKARTLPADVVILDLEDAVAPAAKEEARALVRAAIAEGGFGDRELVVRANAATTPWGADDLAAAATTGAHGVLLPKVERADEVRAAEDALCRAGAPADLALWCMIETPRGVLAADEIASASPRLAALVAGTSDLVKDLRARHTRSRVEVLASLSWIVLAARAHRLAAIDGVHLDLDDTAGLEAACRQGRDLGFDGKTLIHPRQIEAANLAFAPAAEEVEAARAIVAAHAAAVAEGKGVTVVSGRLVEALHVEEAHRMIALHGAIAARGRGH